MNKVVLLGRVTKDIEMRYTQEQKAVGTFHLAVDRGGKDKKADFIRCIAFGKTAELMEKYSGKGKRVLVDGRIITGSYESKEGRTVYTTDIYADRVQFIDFKENNAQNGAQGATQGFNAPEGFEEYDELPF